MDVNVVIHIPVDELCGDSSIPNHNFIMIEIAGDDLCYVEFCGVRYEASLTDFISLKEKIDSSLDFISKFHKE